jgi:hypothetical protein
MLTPTLKAVPLMLVFRNTWWMRAAGLPTWSAWSVASTTARCPFDIKVFKCAGWVSVLPLWPLGQACARLYASGRTSFFASLASGAPTCGT